MKVIKNYSTLDSAAPYLDAICVCCSTCLLLTRIYHRCAWPPPYGFEWLHFVGLLTLGFTWLHTTKPYWVQFSWYANSNCDLFLRLNCVHYAWIHSFLLLFFVIGLDIARTTKETWDRTRGKMYIVLKISFVLVALVHPTLVGVLVGGKATPIDGEDFSMCTWDFSSTARKLLPIAMTIQQCCYLAVLILFIRPLRELLEVVDSIALQQLVKQTMFWNTAVISAEIILLVVAGLAINFLEASTLQHEVLTRLQLVDCLLVMLLIVMCLWPPPIPEPKPVYVKPFVTSSTTSVPRRVPRARKRKRKRKKSRRGSVGPFGLKDALDTLSTPNGFTIVHLTPSLESIQKNSTLIPRGSLQIVPEQTTLSERKHESEDEPGPDQTCAVTELAWDPTDSDLLVSKLAKRESFSGYGNVTNHLDDMFADLPANFNLGLDPGPASRQQEEKEERVGPREGRQEEKSTRASSEERALDAGTKTLSYGSLSRRHGTFHGFDCDRGSFL